MKELEKLIKKLDFLLDNEKSKLQQSKMSPDGNIDKIKKEIIRLKLIKRQIKRGNYGFTNHIGFLLSRETIEACVDYRDTFLSDPSICSLGRDPLKCTLCANADYSLINSSSETIKDLIDRSSKIEIYGVEFTVPPKNLYKFLNSREYRSPEHIKPNILKYERR